MYRRIVIVANSAETFSSNTLRMRTAEARDYQTRYDQSLGERGLLWAGGDKLVVTSQPVSGKFARHIQSAMGYRRLETISPAQPSLYLCRDVWNDLALFKKVVSFCGTAPVDLIPYTTTADFLELAERLQEQGVQVFLPESVNRQTLWLRDYLDTKLGFRMLWQTLSNRLKHFRLPQGFSCRTCPEAAEVVCWFLERGIKCLIKANLGAGGEGLAKFDPGAHTQNNLADVLTILEANPFLDNDLLIVEELITMDPSVAGGSPSIDLCVPPPGQGEPRVLCLSGQMLAVNGEFLGVKVYRDILSDSMTKAIRQDGLCIAHEVARMGYVGPFDIDLVAGEDGNLYAVEMNMRRTGGSHAHDAASYLFGPDYVERVAVLAASKSVTEVGPLSYEALYDCLSDLIHPMGTSKSGLIFTNISLLDYGSFGYIIIAPSREQVHAIQEEIFRRVQSLANEQG